MNCKLKKIITFGLLMGTLIMQACNSRNDVVDNGSNNKMESTIPAESRYMFQGGKCKGDLPDNSQIKKIALSKHNKEGGDAYIWTVIYGEIDFEEAKSRYGTNSGGRLDNLTLSQEYDLTAEDMDRYRDAVNQKCLKDSLGNFSSGWWKIAIEYQDGKVYSYEIHEEGYKVNTDENKMINAFFDKMDISNNYKETFSLFGY